MSRPVKLLVATNNAGKLREYMALLADLPLQLTTPEQEGIELEVEEDGASFSENALLKARAYCAVSRLPTLADDSGLEVDALGGGPGVYSARYAGRGATDRQRYEKLLKALQGVPPAQRTARFRCVIALVLPDGTEEISEGECEGVIIDSPRGEYGFGYDPVFYIPALGKTMAELPQELKNRIIHRARALMLMKPILRALLDRS
ncbi:MAG: XTP/dITP diphosphatase [Anaerolineae bacterium]